MTVCVATINERAFIIGASDRKLTAGNVSFSPPIPKVTPLTTSIAVMYSGEAALHSEIVGAMKPLITAKIAEHPNKWLSVPWVAELYRAQCAAILQHRAEAAFLTPEGLNYETFISRQRELDPAFLDKIRAQLLSYSAGPPTGGIGSIIAGIDDDGPWLFKTENSQLSDETMLGFAAVGSGGPHADYELMLAGYSRQNTATEALIHTYVAKRRAEVAADVGVDTDMFNIGQNPGTFAYINRGWLDALAKIFAKMRKAEARAYERAAKETDGFLAKVLAAPTPKQQEALPPAPSLGSSGDAAPSNDSKTH